MQLLLLAILGVATLDFLVGTFAHTDEGWYLLINCSNYPRDYCFNYA